MASPIAFRLGMKNAGRLANFLSLTPKVCLLHLVVTDNDFYLCFYGTLLPNFREMITKVMSLTFQGKAGILACKRFGSTALSYEQVRVYSRLIVKKNHALCSLWLKNDQHFSSCKQRN